MSELPSRLREGPGVGMTSPMLERRPTRLAQSLRNNATSAERALWRHLRNRALDGHKFSRQMPVGPFVCDFLCREARLIIEVDGGQHCECERDLSRTAFLEGQGYRVIRFWNNNVLENVEGVVAMIKAEFARSGQPHPQPLPQAGGEQA